MSCPASGVLAATGRCAGSGPSLEATQPNHCDGRITHALEVSPQKPGHAREFSGAGHRTCLGVARYLPDQRILIPGSAVRCPMTGCPGSSPATSSPPEVCASASRIASSSPIAESRCGRTQSRLRRLPPGTYPASSDSRAAGRTGTAAASSTAPTPEARHILYRCPSRPKPVTSVAALKPASSACSAAREFRVVLEDISSQMFSPICFGRVLQLLTQDG